MNEQIGLGAFGTFGEPLGYQQVFFLTTAIRSQLDLNTNAIEVYPGAELYAVKREVSDGVSSICCCLYTYAKEANSNRGGTFIGACVVLRNCVLKGEDIYTLLKELHTDLISNPKNIVDNTLQVQKAEQLVVTEPAGFNRIKANVTSVSSSKIVGIDTQNKHLIQAPAANSTEPIVLFFEAALQHFTHTDTLYFTADKRIVTYVAEKGIIPIVYWAAFQDYKKQIIQQQKEATKKEEAAKKVEAAKKAEKNHPVAKGTKTAVKPELAKTTAYGLLEPWTNVDNQLSKEAFYRMVQNHNTLLQEYLKLSQQQAVPVVSSDNSHPTPATARPRRRIKRKYLVITIFVLFALLIATSVLLLLRPSPAVNAGVATNDSANNIAATQTTIAPPVLSPVPTTELAKADAIKFTKDSIKGKKLDVVIDLLFIRNPKSIGEVYVGQKEAYGALLIQQNETCFKKDSTKTICLCDTLGHIPAVKK